jgi:protein-tyrosine phosphatase
MAHESARSTPSPVFSELPFGLAGRVFRSRMPYSDFDPTGLAWEAAQREGVRTIYLLAQEGEYLSRTGRDLRRFYEEQGIRVVHLPIPDSGLPPDLEALADAVQSACARARSGENLVIHCYAGVGRTGLFAALMARKILGLDGTQAIAWVQRWVPGAVETDAQQRLVRDFPVGGDAKADPSGIL